MLTINDLRASVEGKQILNGINLNIKPGEVHAIMGPNGSGKSTLASVLAGREDYEIEGGTVDFMGKDLLELAPEERAGEGIFLAFQYPVEIPGVSNIDFLRAAYNAKLKYLEQKELSVADFNKLLDEKMALMEIKAEFKERNLNEGFSGGEKKRNEILQMALLDPDLAILDETDSGLDIDAMRIVASGVNSLMTAKRGLILITHYQRLLDYIKPDYVHVMLEGKIVKSGDASLALELENRGYDWLQTSSQVKGSE